MEFNFIIRNKQFKKNADLIPYMFADNDGEMEGITWFLKDVDMYDLLIKSGLFISRSEAKRNWKGDKEIPLGFSDFERLGRRHDIRISIFNPK